MGPRAPSTDLLRALRTAVLPGLHPHHHARPHLHPQTIPHRPLSSSQPSTSPPPPPPSPPSPRTTASPHGISKPPSSTDRGPKSTEDTQTDFSALDVLRNTTAPATSIDACTTTGFHLNNGVRTTGGTGVLLLGGEAFLWRPWSIDGSISELLNKRTGPGVLNIATASMAALAVLYPKPDLLVVGTGARLWMLSPGVRSYLEGLGIRVEVQDTANAASTYNLLATERGVETVGAALLPVGWKGSG